MYGRNGLKFGFLMNPDYLQNWFWLWSIVFLILVPLRFSETDHIWGFCGSSRECVWGNVEGGAEAYFQCFALNSFICSLFGTGCWQYLLKMEWLMYRKLLLYLSISLWCFCPVDFPFENWIWLGIMDLLYAIFTLYYRIISRSVSGSATDSPGDVWGSGWTTCLLCSCPILGYVSKRQLVCKFYIVERSFLWIFCFYYCLYTLAKFYLSFFLSEDFTLK